MRLEVQVQHITERCSALWKTAGSLPLLLSKVIPTLDTFVSKRPKLFFPTMVCKWLMCMYVCMYVLQWL